MADATLSDAAPSNRTATADRGLLVRFDDIWDRVLRIGLALWICRASVLSLLIGSFLLLQTEPVADILTGLAQDAARLGEWARLPRPGAFWSSLYGWWRFGSFYVFAFGWAVAVSYCARVLLNFDLGLLPEERGARELYRAPFKWVPRCLGYGVFVVIGIAQFFVFWKITGFGEGLALTALIALTAVTGWLFHVFVMRRLDLLGWAATLTAHPLVRMAGRPLNALPGAARAGRAVYSLVSDHSDFLVKWLRIRPRVFDPKVKEGLEDVQPVFVPSAARNRDRDSSSLQPLSESNDAWVRVIGVLFQLIFVGFLGWIWAMVSPLKMAAWVTQSGVLFLILAVWIPFFSALTFISLWRRIPALSLLLLVAYVLHLAAPWKTDNHDIRLLSARKSQPQGQTPAPPGRITLDVAKEAWATANKANATTPAPLVIVATAGGGSRAAFWTATVLGAIQDKAPSFRDRVFAISAVSGGALGSAVWSSLLQEQRRPDTNAILCRDRFDESVPASDPKALMRCGQAVAGGDFLGPPFVALGYQDFVFRLLPIKFASDRAAAIETAWEAEWRNRTKRGAGPFAQPFTALAPHAQPGDVWTPLLFFNGTSVHTGRRIVTGHLSGTGSIFTDAFDLFDLLPDGADKRLRLSTAVANAARFPYVLPAGSLRGGKACPDQELCHRIVDGGYFENFGAATAQQLLDALVGKPNVKGDHVLLTVGTKQIAVRLVVLQISSDPDFRDFDPQRFERDDEPRLFAGAMAPPEAMWKARNARGAESTLALQRRVNDLGGRYVHLRLTRPEKSEGAMPLSWWLSRAAQNEIERQRCLDHNKAAFNELGGQLGLSGAFADDICKYK